MKSQQLMFGALAVAIFAAIGADCRGQGIGGVPRFSDGRGTTEWEEWAFATTDYWTWADDQGRSEFTKGSGMIAIADPDEWDDLGDPDSIGTMNSQLNTPPMDVSSLAGMMATLKFDSSWRPEYDNYANQSASVEVTFDGTTTMELLRWNSNEEDTDPGEDDSVDPDSGRRLNPPGVGHGVNADGETEPDSGILSNPAANETVMIDFEVPAGASSAAVSFNMFDGTNDWWWAIDNIEVSGGGSTLFTEDFESLVDLAKPENGGGPIDENPESGAMWRETFPPGPPGDIGFNTTEAYTQFPPEGWSITEGYTGPEGSWANNNGQTVSAPGINVPEPGSVALGLLGLAGLAALRRRR